MRKSGASSREPGGHPEERTYRGVRGREPTHWFGNPGKVGAPRSRSCRSVSEGRWEAYPAPAAGGAVPNGWGCNQPRVSEVMTQRKEATFPPHARISFVSIRLLVASRGFCPGAAPAAEERRERASRSLRRPTRPFSGHTRTTSARCGASSSRDRSPSGAGARALLTDSGPQAHLPGRRAAPESPGHQALAARAGARAA